MNLGQATAQAIQDARPYSMVVDENLSVTIRLAIEAIERGIAGDFAEFGTWLGGSSFAMLLAQRYLYGKVVRPVWMFDSFQGLPPADERDGPLALKYQLETEAPGYLNNCAAPLESVRDAIRGFGFSEDEAIVVPGWFNDSIPMRKDDLSKRGVAVLRVDCDWYDPVHTVLAQIAPLVPEEGAIILDDYFAWDGCAKAVHDFLSRNNLTWRIRSMDRFSGAWMIKRANRTGDL